MLYYLILQVYMLSVLTSLYRTKTIMATTLFAGFVVVTTSFALSPFGSIYIAFSGTIGLFILLLSRHMSAGKFFSKFLFRDLVLSLVMVLVFISGEMLYMYILCNFVILLNYKRLQGLFSGKI